MQTMALLDTQGLEGCWLFPTLAVGMEASLEHDADDVVLGFVSPPGAGTGGLPLKSLFAFERGSELVLVRTILLEHLFQPLDLALVCRRRLLKFGAQRE